MKKMEKKGKKLSPIEKEAKMGVLKDLSSQAGNLLKDKLKGLKKVTVASDSKEGLGKGLEMAEKLIGKTAGPEGRDPEKMVEEAEEERGEDLDKDNEEGESAEHKANVFGTDEGDDDMADMEDCSPEELEEKIQKLQAMKQEKLAKR